MAIPTMSNGKANALADSRWRAPSREARDTLFMVALIGWTIAPHLLNLPLWVAGMTGLVLTWRGWLAWRQAPLPGRAAVLALLGLAAVLTFTAQKTLVSKDAGVTLLVVLMALKTLELRARRDALVVFFLGFFLVLTTFLYSQSLLTAVGTGLSVWGWLTALTLAHIPAGRPTIRQAAALAGRAALVGTPVMIALFLLFPRMGPLWPSADTSSHTGLSDRLELGTVAEIANDDSIAFRIRFDGRPPAASRMYFRGPVLVDTNGREWHAQSTFDGRSRRAAGRAESVEQHGALTPYEVTLEPTQLTWLPMLELTPPQPARSSDDPAQGVQVLDGSDVRPLADLDLQWRTRRPISQRVRLRATAGLDDRIVGATPADLRDNLRLPPQFFPRTRAWSQQWLREHSKPGEPVDADAIVRGLYRYIGSAGFSYTLAPGAYEADPVDGFWLDRKTGFCEHFATSFVVVLRAMGIPARVVTGYQGTDAQPEDGYLIVRQSNAHAWAEYWNPGRGWVRADPTAAVAPDRIERGRALQPASSFVGNAIDAVSPGLIERLRGWRETMDNRWSQWVLGYNRSAQFDLLKKAGIGSPDSDDLGRLLMMVISGAALIGTAVAWWDSHRRTPGQRAQRRLASALRALQPHGVQVGAHESPGVVAAVLRRRFGTAAQDLAARLDALERLRYGPDTGGASPDWSAVRTAARALATALALPARAGDATPARASP
ncbi:MAG: transglutaminaseTgpA domain-containing protein [Vitreoscilla sp.]